VTYYQVTLYPPNITPVTLAIETTSCLSYALADVSMFDWDGLDFASVIPNSQGACVNIYKEPQFEVLKVANTPASQTAVLPIATPGNSPNIPYV
jgi:hypothetical protein